VAAFTLLQALLNLAWTGRAGEDWRHFYWLHTLTIAVPLGVPAVSGTLSRMVAATRPGQSRPGGSRRFLPPLGAAIRRYPALLAVVIVQLPVLWVSVLHVFYGTLGPVALLFLSTPALVLATLGWFSVPAIMLEGLGPVAAVRRSFGLVAGRFWRVLGTIALVLLLVLVGAVALNLLLTLLDVLVRVLVDGPVRGVTLLRNLAGYFVALGAFLVVPAVAATVAYLDARHRAEGLTPDQLQAEPPAPEGREAHRRR
jgi:hypothetical protein